MILIADSGSTKTLWVLIKDNKVVFKKLTTGLNPNYTEIKQIEQTIKEILTACKLKLQIKKVFFYGSGCSAALNRKIISIAFKRLLPKAIIKIETDVLGAARAMDNGTTYIACILGTGSNACLYNGKKISYKIQSYGYLFGDYGSGANLGKNLLQKYFDNTLSKKLKEAIFKGNVSNINNFIASFYKNEMPNKFLASFAYFFSNKLFKAELQEIKLHSLSNFFEKQVSMIPNSKNYILNFSGSIAWYFKEEISEIAKSYGYKPGSFYQSPMDGLIKFHCKKN